MAIKRKTSSPQPPFKSRGAIIAVQMGYNDISLKKLAEMTNLSYRTVNKAKRGWPVSEDALVTISLALGLEYELLVWEPRSHPGPTKINPSIKEPRRLTDVVVTAPPFEVLSKEKALKQLIQSLSDTMRAAEMLLKLDVRRGSPIITFSISYSDIHRLCNAFVTHRLRRFRIAKIGIRRVAEPLNVMFVPPQPDLETTMGNEGLQNIRIFSATIEQAMNIHSALRPDVLIIDARSRLLRLLDEALNPMPAFLRLQERFERLGTRKFIVRTNSEEVPQDAPSSAEYAALKNQIAFLRSKILSLAATLTT